MLQAGTTPLTEQATATFSQGSVALAGWFVTSGHPLVHQRFYAAIDCNGSLCWTDDPSYAEQFPLRQDAERFAGLACPDEDWAVTR